MESVETIIVSDVHLGSGVSRPAALLRVLKEHSFERLIINGDLFEDLDFTRLRKRHWKLLSYLRKLSKPERGVEVVWVIGNHDVQALGLGSMLGARICREYTWESNGHKCIAVHGHQFDRFVRERVVVTALATAFYGLVQRIDSRGYRCSRFLKRACKLWLRNSELVAERALAYARRRGAEVIVCGHTHQALKRAGAGGVYFNSGCWTDHYSYIAIRPYAKEWIRIEEEPPAGSDREEAAVWTEFEEPGEDYDSVEKPAAQAV
jgi:UDP-2,3-diacylglucosamine pyrophosphatase LpxH